VSSTPRKKRVSAHSGGAGFHPGLSDRRPPVITRLTVSRGSDRRGRPVRVRYFIRDRAAKVRVTLSFVRPGTGTVFRARRGWQRTAQSHSFTWSAADENRLVPDGSYEIRVDARDPGGNHLARSTTIQKLVDTPPPPPAAVSGSHRFPVAGPYSFGGSDARFGAGRPGHIHQGQDVMAASGTPVVAPATGVITYRAYQADGAGYYLVMHADGERYDYVFMHLQPDVLVGKGDRVTAGQQLGRVGQTGSADGPHLHFEIWDGPWYNGGHTVDPLPFLRAWAT
jgi:murein DD-endopeptidase MepM/ murein hydrolase activator NlpD